MTRAEGSYPRHLPTHGDELLAVRVDTEEDAFQACTRPAGHLFPSSPKMTQVVASRPATLRLRLGHV